jgi:hypothetical protein
MLTAKLSTSITLADLKAKGASIVNAAGKNTTGVLITIGTDRFYASKSKSFEGDITLATTVIEGANADGEARLYLTNKVGGFTTGAAL